ncbi:amino-acid transporter subunit; periplasmic-binding component of ABC superfamily [Magnetospirillum sp. LM-5]|uniref:amino acid ABC transporter substrate-binding protein n=1 Tax=Magnetospirillum sp. LM-5 TaxID=2681466 RepID=UPI001384783E|nr:amino acid ABC transporter substrate-binding protein [Magnetospirillum sp. LM-5]CAA7611540.1 amino-acid transporter subunit; periplasmic-binding component of ABC superfamily [Magnetospirillum sp. LM-5]
MKIIKTVMAAAAAALFAGPALAGQTFDSVKAKGFVQCGVNLGLYGFSAPDDKGNWSGLDVDACRAVAAALFGDSTKVKFTPLSAQQRLPALQSGEIDMLARNTTWTLSRDTANGLNFTTVNYYDGQGFMVAKKLGVKSAKELNGATVCVLPGTTTEQNLSDYFRATKMTFKPVVIEKNEELNGAFFSGRCDAISSDASQLAAIRANESPNPDDYVILPELISKEPLAPAVRQGDDQWMDLVRWSGLAMIAAEEKGITSANVDQMMSSADPEVKRLLGVTPGNGKALGIDEAWAAKIIKQVGNYGESFERNVGKGSKLKISRGLNALYTQGGLLYAPPFK